MSNMSKEEYLQLINKLLEEDLFDEEENFLDPSAGHWIPAESTLKNKIPTKIQNGIINLTNIKKDKIKQHIFNSDTFIVDNYIIKIEWLSCDINYNNRKINILIFEEKFKTPSGAPCRMTYKVNLRKDARFTNCPWLNKLTPSGHILANTNIDSFTEVIRWLQIAKKLNAFT